VDTPETKWPDRPVQHFGPEAADFTRTMCLDKQVRLELEVARDARDKYGRLLAWVYLPDGRMLNRLLVEQGFAYADPRFEHHLLREFKALQKQARQQRLGLWQNLRPSDLPGYYQNGPHRIKLP
jgi:micrococcal nuclease